MSPREFPETVAVPNLQEFRSDASSLRAAYNAIASIDSLSAHLLYWARERGSGRVPKRGDDNKYRKDLIARSVDFGVITQIAKAQKHVLLDSTPHRGIQRASQVSRVQVRYDGSFHHDATLIHSATQVVIRMEDGLAAVLPIAQRALEFLKQEIREIECSRE